MSTLDVTHRTTVTEDQIDHLGHMNVRYYGVAARAGSDAVLADIGIPADATVEAVDHYTRHHREQLVGAELEVRTGILAAGAGILRLYHELVDSGSGDLAATFVHRLECRGPEGPLSTWPSEPLATSDEIPEHGRPRSISLDTDPVGSAPDLATVRARGLAMRRPRAVLPEECGPDGVVSAADAPSLIWGGEPLDGATAPSLHPGPAGELVGWASMETRLVLRRTARVGDRIESFGATVSIGEKITQQVMWAFDAERGDLLCTFEVVNLAFDTVGRRAVPVPDDLRRHSEARLHPDLLPR